VPPGPTGTSATSCDLTLPESVRRVIESRAFERAPTLRALLVYLWRMRDEPVSEYAIATEALGRSPSFDAKTDATVRVQISRLRQRLEKFYQQEGAGCTERVVIPLGSHHVEMETAGAVEPEHAVPPVEPATPPARPANRLLLGICIALALVATGLGTLLMRARTATRANTPQGAPRLWQAFFGNKLPTRIILPTPVFLSFTPNGPLATVMVRDTSVNDFADRERSRQYATFEKMMGKPQLAQNYTVTSDTFASVSLVRYLDRFAFATAVRSSAEAPLDALDSENVIAIGTWGTLNPVKPYLDHMNFRLSDHEMHVSNRQPAPSEPAEIDQVIESTERSIWPGVIAVLPGHGGKSHLLVVASRQTSALVSLLTSSNGLEKLEQLWRSKGSPQYYEVVVQSEMNGPNLVRSTPVMLHAFKAEAGVTAGN
jgi:hypothetical protein